MEYCWYVIRLLGKIISFTHVSVFAKVAAAAIPQEAAAIAKLSHFLQHPEIKANEAIHKQGEELLNKYILNFLIFPNLPFAIGLKLMTKMCIH